MQKIIRPALIALGLLCATARADLPFAVTDTFPANAAISASRTGAIEVTFNDAVNPATVNSNTFRVWGRQSGFRSGTYLTDPVRFVPSKPFFAGEIVDVTLTAGIQTTNGTELKPATWRFHAETLGSTNYTVEPMPEPYPTNRVIASALGDLDRDGDLDYWELPSGPTASPSNSFVWRNNGDGAMTSDNIAIPGLRAYGFVGDGLPYNLLLADLNQDGNLDALRATSTTNPFYLHPVEVSLNSANSSFTPSAQAWSVSPDNTAIDVGDFDADGDMDVVVGRRFPGRTNEVWFNVGNGEFAFTGVTVGTNTCTSVCSGDFNGDYATDILMAYTPTYSFPGDTNVVLHMWLNSGIGHFTEAYALPVPALPTFAWSIAAGDLDADGDIDALITGGFSGLLRNDGAGNLIDEISPMQLPESYASQRDLGDIDGDHDLDVITTTSWGWFEGRVLLNSGNGSFTNDNRARAVSSRSLFGDLDGDGDLDTLVSGPAFAYRTISESDAGVSIQGPNTLYTGQPFAYTISYSNNGPVGARELTITADFPASHLTVQGFASSSLPAPALFTNSPTWTWRLLAPLMPGESGTFTVTGLVANIGSFGSVTAHVTVAVAETDSVTANNAASITSAYTPRFALSLVATNGAITNAVSGSYLAGSAFTLYPRANAGYGFTGWTTNGTVAGAAIPLALTLNAPITVTAYFSLLRQFADFDDDGVTDVAVFHAPTGRWGVRQSTSGTMLSGGLITWGAGGIPVPGDYDGDALADLATYEQPTGLWRILRSSDDQPFGGGPVKWGPGSIPVPRDYDGDGTWDLAVYAPSDGKWYVRKTSNDLPLAGSPIAWGPNAVPVPEDYDGDGLADLAVYASSDGKWYIRKSSNGLPLPGSPFTWGPQSIPVPGDYDGDGIADLAVYAPSDGKWYVRKSSTGLMLEGAPIAWGAPVAAPVPDDYDGDGKRDLAVYVRSSGKWFIRKSSNGQLLNVDWGHPQATPASTRYQTLKLMGLVP